jgi:hypothetical protein
MATEGQGRVRRKLRKLHESHCQGQSRKVEYVRVKLRKAEIGLVESRTQIRGNERMARPTKVEEDHRTSKKKVEDCARAEYRSGSKGRESTQSSPEFWRRLRKASTYKIWNIPTTESG